MLNHEQQQEHERILESLAEKAKTYCADRKSEHEEEMACAKSPTSRAMIANAWGEELRALSVHDNQHDEAELKAVFERAKKGDLSVLDDPLVNHWTYRRGMGWTPLHELAKQGRKEILAHPHVAVNFGGYVSALHELAEQGCVDVLEHPEVATSFWGTPRRAPLHYLAMAGKVEVLKHPLATTLGERYFYHNLETHENEMRRKTPLYYLARSILDPHIKMSPDDRKTVAKIIREMKKELEKTWQHSFMVTLFEAFS